ARAELIASGPDRMRTAAAHCREKHRTPSRVVAPGIAVPVADYPFVSSRPNVVRGRRPHGAVIVLGHVHAPSRAVPMHERPETAPRPHVVDARPPNPAYPHVIGPAARPPRRAPLPNPAFLCRHPHVVAVRSPDRLGRAVGIRAADAAAVHAHDL